MHPTLFPNAAKDEGEVKNEEHKYRSSIRVHLKFLCPIRLHALHVDGLSWKNQSKLGNIDFMR
jgi:hypothetical protein